MYFYLVFQPDAILVPKYLTKLSIKLKPMRSRRARFRLTDSEEFRY